MTDLPATAAYNAIRGHDSPVLIEEAADAMRDELLAFKQRAENAEADRDALFDGNVLASGRIKQAEAEVERLTKDREGWAKTSVAAENEAKRLRADHAPHYCADGHAPIRHWDSESEMCPLCKAEARVAELEKLVANWYAWWDGVTDGLTAEHLAASEKVYDAAHPDAGEKT